MDLSGDELRKIREALRQAFPAATKQLDVVVADADIGVDFAEYDGPYEYKLLTLLQYALGQYKLTKLLRAAVRAAPENSDLLEIAAFVQNYFELLPRFVRDDDTKLPLGDIERVLFKNAGFQNVREWLEKLDRLSRIVCRIEPQPRAEGIAGYGTGFLVGPDLILTNDHVVSGSDGSSGFWGKRDDAAKVRIRFDCAYESDGRIDEGKIYRLATDYAVLRSPLDQLDFALLKLDSSAVDASDHGVAGKRRGFATLAEHAFEESEPLLILQHPQAEPMKLALGSVTGRNRWPLNRVHYFVNSDGGSSGSPCLTQNLDVGALHHRGSNSHNSGVLMSAILAHWRKPENRDVLLRAGVDSALLGTESTISSIYSSDAPAYIPNPTIDASTLSNRQAIRSPLPSNETVFVHSDRATAHPKSVLPHPGGALPANSPLYVERFVDAVLLGRLIHSSTSGLVSLVGPRQIGKSSMVIRLLHAASQHGCGVVRIDCSGLGVNTAAELIAAIASEIQSASLTAEPGIEYDMLSRDRPLAIRHLRNCLRRLHQRTVIALDEVDYIRHLDDPEPVFGAIRSFIDDAALLHVRVHSNPAPFTLLSASFQHILTLDTGGDDRSTFNSGADYRVDPFDLNELKKLLAAASLSASPGDVEALYELSGGHPCVAQHVIHIALRDGLAPEELSRDLHRHARLFAAPIRIIQREVENNRTVRDALSRFSEGEPSMIWQVWQTHPDESADETKRSDHMALIEFGLVREDNDGRLVFLNSIYRIAFGQRPRGPNH